MCGGANHDDRKPVTPAAPPGQYTPPDLKSLYETFQKDGTVPYSYYGVGAPTREGELDLVRKSYPGAYTDPATPPPPPAPQKPKGFLDVLISALRGVGSNPKTGPFGQVFTGAADGFQSMQDRRR